MNDADEVEELMPLPHFGEHLVDLLDRRVVPVSQRQLALATGVSQSHINQICTGRRRLTYEVALLIEQATDLTAAFLMRLQAGLEERRVRDDKDFQERLKKVKKIA